MSGRRLSFLIAAVVLAVTALPFASRAQAPPGGPSWATINVCAPGAVGVRAGAAGYGSSASLARFTLEWFSAREGRWAPVVGQSRSPRLPVGSDGQATAQAGWTFDVDAPPPGARFTLRGVAEIQWRRGGRVVRRATKVASAGVAGVAEGRPPGTSLASCVLG
jgi:hypothetical protein